MTSVGRRYLQLLGCGAAGVTALPTLVHFISSVGQSHFLQAGWKCIQMDGVATGQWTMAVCLALWNLVSHCVVSEVEETALRETRVPFHSQGGICYTIIIQISLNITVINNAKKKSVRREDVKEEEKKEKRFFCCCCCSSLRLYPEELTKANNTIVILTIQNQHRLFAFCHLLTQNVLLFMFLLFRLEKDSLSLCPLSILPI